MLKHWPSCWSNLRQIWLYFSLNDTGNITHEKANIWFWRFSTFWISRFWCSFLDMAIRLLLQLKDFFSPSLQFAAAHCMAVYPTRSRDDIKVDATKVDATKVDATTNLETTEKLMRQNHQSRDDHQFASLLLCSAPSSINALLTRRLTSYLAAFTSWPAGRLLPINAETTFLLYFNNILNLGKTSFCHIWQQGFWGGKLNIFDSLQSWQVFLTLSGIEGKKPFDQNGIAERVGLPTKTIFSLYFPFISLTFLNLSFFVSVCRQSHIWILWQDGDI